MTMAPSICAVATCISCAVLVFVGMKLIVKTRRRNDASKNDRTKLKLRKKADKAWLILVAISSFLLLHLMFISGRLESPLPNDLRTLHLESFVNGSDIDTKTDSSTTKILQTASSREESSKLQPQPKTSLLSKNSLIDPYYAENVPSSDGTNLWDKDEHLPHWIKAYFNWHKHKRTTWNLYNYTSERWLIMQCLADQDKRKCGGTADRLKPIPFMLRMAYNTRRILLIRWTRPASLEEFLVPPKNGFDWRVPEEMATIMSNETNGKRLVPSGVIENYASGGMSLIRTRYQSYNGGSGWYNNQTMLDHEQNEIQFNDVYHHIWNIFFRPSVPVAQRIEDQFRKLKLVPGQYASAHLRALYAIDERNEHQIHKWAANALHCASQLRPGLPIFFASDSDKAAAYAKIYGSNHSARVETHTPNPNPPLHLDRCQDWDKRPPSDFYDTFVDLYLLSLGGCVTFGTGGFGHWGLLIGNDPNCFIDQETKANGRIGNTCSWHGGEGHSNEGLPSIEASSTPLFLEAME